MDIIRSTTTVSAARDNGFNLTDSVRFVRIKSVPIIDVLERSYFKKDDDGEIVKVKESVDENQLKILFKNTKEREKKGEYGLIFIGHTDDHGKEKDQPPLVGWLANYNFSHHNDNPAIVADIFLDRELCDPSEVKNQYPRRSAEVISLDKPNGYIDSVALMKRTPERDLGLLPSYLSKSNLDLLTSRYSKRDNATRFECPSGICESNQKIKYVECKHQSFPKARTMSRYSKQRESPEDTSEPRVKKNYANSSSSSEPSDVSEPSVERYARNHVDQDEDISSIPDPSRMDPKKEPRIKHGNLEKEFMKENKASLSKFDYSGDFEPSEEDASEGDDEGMDEEVEDHQSSSSEPSRMCRMGDRERKSKLSAGTGTGAGFPGAYDSAPPDINKNKNKSAKPTIKSHSSRMSRQNREDQRMKRDSENIKKSRFQKDIDELIRQNRELASRFSQAEAEKRQAKIERQIAQLEYEGYELDRADEVTRFMKLSEDEIEPEIKRIRTRYSKSPVNQSAIPSLSGDFGGSSLPKPERYVDPRLPLPEEYQQPNCPIIGSHVYRFYKENKQDLAPPLPENPMAPRPRGDMTHPVKVVSRFISSREKSNV
jgi:hypothetical protein